MSTKQSYLSIADLYFDADEKILTIHYHQDKDITEKGLGEIINTGLKMAQGQPFGVISTLGNNSISREAQKIMSQSSPGLVAVAAIIEIQVLRTIIEIFVREQKVKYDLRCFTDIDQAKKWVKQQLDKHQQKA